MAKKKKGTKKKGGAKKKKGAHATDATLLGASQLEDLILMDQEPLPRTSRSNPATYLKVFDDIRALFADTQAATMQTAISASGATPNTTGSARLTL